MKRSFFTSTLFAALVGVLVVLVLPHIIRNNYLLTVLSLVAIYTILAVGLNLLMGYAGQVSLGHAAFFGLGAYTSAILTTQLHLSPWLAMPLGIALTCAVAVLIGIPCLRLRGHYLAMATLGVGWIIFIVMKQWTPVTQGTSGIEGIPKLAIGPLIFNSDIKLFYLTWITAVLVLVISSNIVNSRVGRALRSLHGSEAAAATLGVDVARYKVLVFVISAAYASLAGSLYAHTVNFISPSTFSFTFSVSMVVMVVIGGMASVWGAPVGAATITFLAQWLQGLGEHVKFLKEFDVIAHGAILMLVMIFMPAGLVCGVRDVIERWFRKRKAKTPAPPPAKEVALP